jgi:hypothetical protein
MTWPILALLGGALLVGCGGGGSSSSSATTSQSTATTATTSSTPAPTSSTPTAATPSSAVLQQAAERCRSLIGTQASLPSTTKAKLEAICNKVAKGDTNSVRQAAQEVCGEIINNSGVAAAIRAQALAACKSSAK